jgi:hypothetical protein
MSTKKELVEKIFANIECDEERKQERIKMAVVRNTKRRIEEVYRVAMTDKGNSLFYARLLTR